MKTIVILQARLGSTRLPAKVIADLSDKPLLARVVARARRIPGVDQVVLATTGLPEDRKLIAIAKEWDLPVYAGSPEDVLDRYYQAARTFSADVIVRVTADCPLLDPEVSGRVVVRFGQGDVDYAGNVNPPTFPDGLDTEVFSRDALERAWSEARLQSEREHVTPYIRNHPDRFRLANVQNDIDLSAHRWTVDEPADLTLIRRIYEHLSGEAGEFFGMADVLALLERQPDLRDINAGIARDEGYAKSLREDEIR
jgi:spore coat polysaccharide biosynthesis protein SpsF (cytidylyltransferase family)